MAALSLVRDQSEPLVDWLEASLHDIAGRDPLGLNTITTDRILPQLLPGILQLSERARYFSIYSWMLWQFAERRRPATTDELDRFIRRREFELCLAMRLCKHCEAESAIGTLSARPHITAGEDPLQRGVSVESSKGGFGLYYRTPLVELGAVARVGTPLGEDAMPTPVEVLWRGDPRAVALAHTFHDAIKTTRYYGEFERTSDPIPRQVLEELAEQVCLCRLPYRERERDAIRTLIFEPANEDPAILAACDARRRAFALFLSLLDADPQVAYDLGRFWRALIGRFEANPTANDVAGRSAAPWAALAMKECVQEAICSIWTHFCRSGLHGQPSEGLSRNALSAMIHQLADGSDLALDEISLSFSAGEAAVPARRRLSDAAAEIDWNRLRAWTAKSNSGASGLAALLIFTTRVPDPREVHPLWGEIARRGSEHQDGLLGIVSLVSRRLRSEPTVVELLEWLIRRFIIGPHEVIAYSKLPEATFRFSWEETGRLHFFNPGGAGLERFYPSDDRRGVMANLSRDLGYWTVVASDEPRLTGDGRKLIAEAFG